MTLASTVDLQAVLTASGVPSAATIWVPAILVLTGVAGIVVPVLPGLPLVAGGVLLWAVLTGGTTAWVVAALAVVLATGGTLLQYLLPGRAMRRAGVGTGTLALGAVVGIVGLFVVPVLGLPLGFVAGVYLAELARSGTGATPGPDAGAADGSRSRAARAWASTRTALVAVAQSMGIELATGMVVTLVWVVAVAATWPPGA